MPKFEKVIARNLGGWFYTGEQNILQDLSIGKTCLEIGAYMGNSTCTMAEVAKSVEVIDTFTSDALHGKPEMAGISTLEVFLDNIKEYDNVTWHQGYSRDIMPTITEKFDVIFIDGDHSTPGVMEDIELTLKNSHPETVYIFHDYSHLDSVKNAVDTYFEDVEVMPNPAGERSVGWAPVKRLK